MSRTDQRHDAAQRLLDQLRARHPVLKHYRPLDESGVEQALTAAHPDLEPWLIRLALHLHLQTAAYLQALSHGGLRHSLQGEPAGEVDGETRHHARARLKHHRSHRHPGDGP